MSDQKGYIKVKATVDCPSPLRIKPDLPEVPQLAQLVHLASLLSELLFRQSLVPTGRQGSLVYTTREDRADPSSPAREVKFGG